MRILSRKFWSSNVLWLKLFLLLGIVGATCFFAGRASADPVRKPQKISNNSAGFNRRIERSDWVNPTTTTTTAVPVKQHEGRLAPRKPVVAVEPQSYISPDHTELLTQAGIDPAEWEYVEYILKGENSSWNPCLINGGVVDCAYQGTRAYGVPQAKPGGKMASAGADWETNPVTQLHWMDMYCDGDKYPGMKSRFRNWAAAAEYKRVNGTY